jgi:uncharacterized peroxidase-related enzyme
MSRITMIDPAVSTGAIKELLDKTQKQLGRVPNLYRAMANAPAALEGYLNFRGALVNGQLSMKLREQLALLIAEDNGCEYCVSAHTFRGEKIGLSTEELSANRQADSSDLKSAAALRFAQLVVAHKGDVADGDVGAVRAAGWSDGEISEIVAHVALNIFSNYFSHVARPDLDFPRTELCTRG